MQYSSFSVGRRTFQIPHLHFYRRLSTEMGWGRDSVDRGCDLSRGLRQPTLKICLSGFLSLVFLSFVLFWMSLVVRGTAIKPQKAKKYNYGWLSWCRLQTSIMEGFSKKRTSLSARYGTIRIYVLKNWWSIVINEDLISETNAKTSSVLSHLSVCSGQGKIGKCNTTLQLAFQNRPHTEEPIMGACSQGRQTRDHNAESEFLKILHSILLYTCWKPFTAYQGFIKVYNPIFRRMLLKL